MIAFLRVLWRWLRTLSEAARPEGTGGSVPHAQRPPNDRDVRPECSLRIPRALLDQMWSDLRRPHAFAYERVGFLLVREAESPGGRILLARRYEPVREEEYTRDTRVGARINRDAIRRALGYALTGEGVLHVHLHAHQGVPGFSHVDEKNLHDLVPSFCAVAPHVIHGALLLSDDHGIAWCWRDGHEGAFPASKITIVGTPLLCWEVPS
jgi:hypothetical protein